MQSRALAVVALLTSSTITIPYDAQTASAMAVRDREPVKPGSLRLFTEERDVIIEFRAQPLLASGGSSNEKARRDLASSFDRLESDLGRLAGASGKRAPQIRHRFTQTYAGASARVPASMLAELARLDYVARVLPDTQYEATLEASLPHIGVPAAWSAGNTRGKGVTVAIIDTGIAYTHPAFGGTFGPGSRVVAGYDFVNDDNDPMDDQGHGTHVAGIVGGNGGGVVGVAPEVTFVAYKVLNARGSGTSSDIIAALERSVDPNRDNNTADRVDIVNLSLGGPSGPGNPVTKAVETGSAAGTLFVVAAGNVGRFFTIGSPGDAATALTVGASGRDTDTLATFSSRGPVAGTGMLKPDVLAPGVSIVSAAHNGGLLTASGTSMATPHVVGVAALVKSVHRDWTPAQVKSAVVNSAQAFDGEVMATGAGRVDAFAAVSATVVADPSVISFGVDDLGLDSWTTSQRFRLQNKGSKQVRLGAAFSGTDANITLSADPSSVTLAPGQTHEITLRLTIANRAFETPKQGSLSFGGQVEFSGEGARVRIPWAFVKAARATVMMSASDYYEVSLTSADTSAFIFGGTTRFDFIVTPGNYDVEVFGTFGGSDTRLVVVEQKPVRGYESILVDGNSASTSIALNGRDEIGQTLYRPGRMCASIWTLVLPEESQLAWLGFFGEPSLYISPVSERFKLLPLEICSTTNRRDIWLAQYDVVTDLRKNALLGLATEDWHTQRVEIDVPEGAKNPSLFAGGWMLYRALDSYGGAGFGFSTPMTERWDGTFHFTPDKLEGIGAAAFFELTADNPDSPSGGKLLAVESPMLRPAGNVLVASSFLTPSPVSYLPRDGEALRFHRGAFSPDVVVGVRDEQLTGVVSWTGSLEEIRYDIMAGQTIKVTTPSGAIVEDKGSIVDAPLESGEYVLESTVPIRIEGVTGQQKVTTRLDRRKSDGTPPTLTALRVRDGNGRAASRIRGEGSLQFHASDISFDETGRRFRRNALPEGSARVWFRASGQNVWSELPVKKGADDVGDYTVLGHTASGTAFTADLRDALTTGGAIDLRIEVRDPSGNSSEVVIEPALISDTGKRRRPVRP